MGFPGQAFKMCLRQLLGGIAWVLGHSIIVYRVTHELLDYPGSVFIQFGIIFKGFTGSHCPTGSLKAREKKKNIDQGTRSRKIRHAKIQWLVKSQSLINH